MVAERSQGGGRLLAVGNAVGAGVGGWECLWGRVRAGVLGGEGGTPPPVEAIPGGGGGDGSVHVPAGTSWVDALAVGFQADIVCPQTVGKTMFGLASESGMAVPLLIGAACTLWRPSLHTKSFPRQCSLEGGHRHRCGRLTRPWLPNAPRRQCSLLFRRCREECGEASCSCQTNIPD